MKDDWKIKTLMLSEMIVKGRKGRPCREWFDGIEEWCEKDNSFLNRHSPLVSNGLYFKKSAVDMYGLLAHGF